MYVGAKEIARYTREARLERGRSSRCRPRTLSRPETPVLVSVLQSGVGKASGAPAELRCFTLWSFRGPQVIRIKSSRERAEALEAAGLRE
jgi:hypothetical protein